MVELESTPDALERHWAFHGAKLSKMNEYRGHKIYLSEGGPHYDTKHHKIVDSDPGPDELLKEDAWMKQGYYVSAWGIMRGPAVLGFSCYFKLDHDMNLNSKDRSKARLEAANVEAKQAIDMMINSGLLENYSGSILVSKYIQ